MLQGKLHSDTVLLGVVAILSMPVVTIMIVWTVVDPYVAIKYLTKTSEVMFPFLLACISHVIHSLD